MEASDSLPEFREWIFFIPFPFPNFGNGYFSFPSRSRTLGMDFFIPFPFPNFGNGIFSFPSHSRNLGMDFFIPFPFPNFGNGLFQFPSRSRISGMGFFNSLPVPEPSKVIPAHPWTVLGYFGFLFTPDERREKGKRKAQVRSRRNGDGADDGKKEWKKD